jgi:hypothetical protein
MCSNLLHYDDVRGYEPHCNASPRLPYAQLRIDRFCLYAAELGLPTGGDNYLRDVSVPQQAHPQQRIVLSVLER